MRSLIIILCIVCLACIVYIRSTRQLKKQRGGVDPALTGILLLVLVAGGFGIAYTVNDDFKGWIDGDGGDDHHSRSTGCASHPTESACPSPACAWSGGKCGNSNSGGSGGSGHTEMPVPSPCSSYTEQGSCSSPACAWITSPSPRCVIPDDVVVYNKNYEIFTNVGNVKGKLMVFTSHRNGEYHCQGGYQSNGFCLVLAQKDTCFTPAEQTKKLFSVKFMFIKKDNPSYTGPVRYNEQCYIASGPIGSEGQDVKHYIRKGPYKTGGQAGQADVASLDEYKAGDVNLIWVLEKLISPGQDTGGVVRFNEAFKIKLNSQVKDSPAAPGSPVTGARKTKYLLPYWTGTSRIMLTDEKDAHGLTDQMKKYLTEMVSMDEGDLGYGQALGNHWKIQKTCQDDNSCWKPGFTTPRNCSAPNASV